MDASVSAANSPGDERIKESPRARKTTASAKMMNPVQQMGVFQVANGSMPASVAASETRMIASPISMQYFSTTDDTDTN